jgi:ATP/maltotriose-dependent transcriptional regulator MalT
MTRRAPATRQNPPVTLVLDNFHLLTDPAVLDGLDYVLRNTGAGLRLVMSARTDPPLPLHRYRLAGQLTEIRASDLAFTVAEAGLLLARHGQIMPADSLKRLTQRTEGWAAGLRLAAIRLPAPPGVLGQALGLAAGPLSRREQEVLRRVSRLLSTAEIASEMHISINTVKTHLAHINRKVATTRRAEAVRRGRRLELI